MKYVTITSARRNPNLNPRISIVEQLRPFYEKENSDISKYYFTFTDINKVGIKPTYSYNTPLGIYAYPMKQMFPALESNQIPFAGERKFVSVLELNIPSNKVLSQSTTASQTKSALAVLENIFKEEASKKDSYLRKYDNFVRTIDFEKYLFFSKETYGNHWNTTYGMVWNSSHYFATVMYSKSFNTKTAFYWSVLLRKMGFEAALDYKGNGFIHEHEKMQAVFFSKKAIKHIATYDNKKYEKHNKFNSNLYSPNSPKEVIEYFKKEENTTIEKLQGSNIVLSKGKLNNKVVPLFVSGNIKSNIYNSIIGEKREKISPSYQEVEKLKESKLRINDYIYQNNYLSVVKNCLIQGGFIGAYCTIKNSVIENAYIRGEFENCKTRNCILSYDSITFVNVSNVKNSYLFLSDFREALADASHEADKKVPFTGEVTKESEEKRRDVICPYVLERMRKYASIEALVFRDKTVFK